MEGKENGRNRGWREQKMEGMYSAGLLKGKMCDARMILKHVTMEGATYCQGHKIDGTGYSSSNKRNVATQKWLNMRKWKVRIVQISMTEICVIRMANVKIGTMKSVFRIYYQTHLQGQ